MNKVKQELGQLDISQLREKVVFFRRELFVLRLNSSTAHIKDYSQFKKLRKALACALTYLKQEEEAEFMARFFEMIRPSDENKDLDGREGE